MVLRMAFQYLSAILLGKAGQAIDENRVRTDLSTMADKAGKLLPSESVLQLLELARSKRISMRRMSENFPGYLLGYGRRQLRLWSNASHLTSYIGNVVATNKPVAN